MPNPVSDETIERIKAAYAETGSIRAAARAVGCSVSTAKKYVDQGDRDAFERVRTEKRIGIIDALAEAELELVAAMVTRAKSGADTVRDIATALGITVDKRQLLSGKATSRSEHRNMGDPSAVLTPDEMEAAARIRAKLAAEAGA